MLPSMLHTKRKHNLGCAKLGHLILEGSIRKKGMIFINLLKPIVVYRIIVYGGKLFKV